MTTSNTQQDQAAVETARQKAVREMKERLRKEREARGQGPYVPPTDVGGPTRLNK
jgi:hypothetical protein